MFTFCLSFSRCTTWCTFCDCTHWDCTHWDWDLEKVEKGTEVSFIVFSITINY